MADKITLKRILKLFAIAAKIDLAWLLRDSKYALAVIGADVISNLSTVAAMFLIALRFDGIGGLNQYEVLFMMAYSTLVSGLFILFGSQNNLHISRIIGRGQLEHAFIQPVPLKVQLFTGGFSPFTGSANFIVGLVLAAISLHKMAFTPSFLWFLSLFGYVVVTFVIIVARSYLVSSIAFYAPTAAEEISTTVIEGTWLLSTFPLSGMPKAIQFTLVTLLPEGLMAWFPALSLLGKAPLGLTPYYPLFFAFCLSLIATYFFRKGLKYYVQTGSNRYLPYGFRR